MSESATENLIVSWRGNMLTVRGERLPEGGLRVQYLESYCRPGSTDREWGETCIPYESELVSASGGQAELRLKHRLEDGVVATHVITASAGEVGFRVEMHNPTDAESEAHWGSACIRVGRFAGFADESDTLDYLGNCFVFIDGELARMPTPAWATEARYTPGQVWCPAHVPRTDVDPRPLNPRVPSNGLIGCFSGDERTILATAWQPYQMLFQGVITCIHSDFRIGGLGPNETKHIRGKIYIVPNDIPALLARYERDFPEHRSAVPDA